MICIENVTKWYKQGRLVLDRLCFEADEGEKLLIVGNAGSGKTTLAHILSGIIQPDEGTVSRCAGVGIMLEEAVWFEECHVLDNICLPLILAGTGVRQSRDLASALLKSFNMEDKAVRKISQLTAIERRYVQLIQALVRKSEFLVADAPETTLEDRDSDALYGSLLTVAKRLHLGLICFSDRKIQADSFDRVLRLENGKLKEEIKG